MFQSQMKIHRFQQILDNIFKCGTKEKGLGNRELKEIR